MYCCSGSEIEDARTSAVSGTSGGTASKLTVTPAGRSASVSPRSARRQFFDQYPYDPSSQRAYAGGATVDTGAGAAAAAGETSSGRGPGRPDPAHAPRSASVTRDDPLKTRISSAASSFFQSIKDRRKVGRSAVLGSCDIKFIKA